MATLFCRALRSYRPMHPCMYNRKILTVPFINAKNKRSLTVAYITNNARDVEMDELKSDIREIKRVNSQWASDAVVLAAVTAKEQRINILSSAPAAPLPQLPQLPPLVRLPVELRHCVSWRPFFGETDCGNNPTIVEIYELKADIREIKRVNSQWASDAVVLAAVTAKEQRINTLSDTPVVPLTVQQSLARLPDELGFSNCWRPRHGKNACKRLVGVEKMTSEACEMVKAELNKEVGARPLIFCRMVDGGKTTALCSLFDRLRNKENFHPIFISLGESVEIVQQRRQRETDRDLILRSIALQLIGQQDNHNPLDITCDEHRLDEHLSRSDKPVVLIIDDLDAYTDSEALDMLCRLFLDKKGRGLVCSSLQPVVHLEGSGRKVHYVTMPSCYDLPTLSAMSVECYNLSANEMLYYGGIPSLIYSVKTSGTVSLTDRFDAAVENETLFNFSKVLYREFVDCVITGDRKPSLALFDQFGTIDAEGKISWPLCYIGCLADLTLRTVHTSHILNSCDALKLRDRQPELVEWMHIFNIAIAFRCSQQSLADADNDTLCSMFGNYYGVDDQDGIDKKHVCYSAKLMPQTVTSMTDIHDWVSETISNILLKQKKTFLLFPSAHSVFKDVDMFVAAGWKLEGGTVQIALRAYQTRPGRPLPTTDLDTDLVKGYILHGDTPTSGSLPQGWEHMPRDQVQELLGYSLASLLL